jgi:hypothetical protein
MRLVRTLPLATASFVLAGLGLAPAALADHGGLVVTGLTQDDRLVTFRALDPGTLLSSTRVTGLGADDLVGIDFRPATGGLYGLGSDGTTARLYLVDRATGAATRVGTADLPVAGAAALDVNPAVDRIRVVGADGTNLRVHPDTGALVATDGPLAYVAGDAHGGDAPGVAAVAYLNNDNDATTSTTLYDLDAALDQLAVQSPPNAGALGTVGALPGATLAGKTGLDIYTRTGGARTNWAFASLFDRGRTTFYEIDLATGAGKPLGGAVGARVGGTPHVTDIALAPAQPGF